MIEIFHDHNKMLQKKYNGERVAEALVKHRVTNTLASNQIEFINSARFFIVGTQGENRIDLSTKCGLPGFASATENKVSWEELDGNSMYISSGNMLRSPSATILFMNLNAQPDGDSNQVNILRITGDMKVDLTQGSNKIIISMLVRLVIPNCPRYLPRYSFVEDSIFLTENREPEWKKRSYIIDLFKDK